MYGRCRRHAAIVLVLGVLADWGRYVKVMACVDA